MRTRAGDSGERGTGALGPGRRRRDESGTVLLLFPAALLSMLVLGAIVIDMGQVHLHGRGLEAVAASAADDILAALDVRAYREGRGVRLDPVQARHVVEEAIGAGPIPEAVVEAIRLVPAGDGRPYEIAVTLRLEIELALAPALGDLDRVTLTRTGRAVILGSA